MMWTSGDYDEARLEGAGSVSPQLRDHRLSNMSLGFATSPSFSSRAERIMMAATEHCTASATQPRIRT